MGGLSDNVKSLHIIRGISSTLVVISHSKFALWSGGEAYLKEAGTGNLFQKLLLGIDLMSSCGSQCVLIFFMLSGFLIQYNFTQSKTNWKQFYIVRLIRIYFPYIASALISIAVLIVVVKLNNKIACDNIREYNTRLLTAYKELSVESFLRLFIFSKEKEFAGFNYAYWSLFHEGIFYLVFPFYSFLNTSKRALLAGLFLSAGWFMSTSTVYMQGFFLVGTLLSDRYYEGKKIFSFITQKPKLFYVLALFAFALLNFAAKISEPIANLFTIVYCAFSFEFLLNSRVRFNKLLVKLSDFSYSIYLFHPCLLLIVYSVFSSWLGKLVFYERYPYYLGALLAIVLSYPLYLCFEKPSQTFISKLKLQWNSSTTKTLPT